MSFKGHNCAAFMVGLLPSFKRKLELCPVLQGIKLLKHCSSKWSEQMAEGLPAVNLSARVLATKDFQAWLVALSVGQIWVGNSVFLHPPTTHFRTIFNNKEVFETLFVYIDARWGRPRMTSFTEFQCNFAQSRRICEGRGPVKKNRRILEYIMIDQFYKYTMTLCIVNAFHFYISELLKTHFFIAQCPP